MQILGKRSKVLLIAVAIAMLVAVGVSFAAWDNMSTVKAATGNSSMYANANVGDIIEFGQYYQTGNRVNSDENAEYEKTPIKWIVVDKDERSGQLTLMSQYILAAGSYFGNYYYNKDGDWTIFNQDRTEVGGNPYNQAYIESTARAFLNNLERRDLGGDSFVDSQFKTCATSSNANTGELLTSVGFSNREYYISGNAYQRPVSNTEYRDRPATLGFYDEAFTDEEKSMIVPKEIAGYTGFRWPAHTDNPSKMTYVSGTIDKIWLPSATELNIMGNEDNYTNPSDASSSTVFEYFKGKTGEVLRNALKTTRTDFLENNSKAMNYSIPVYQYNSTAINDDIHATKNSLNYFWTRSPLSNHYYYMRSVATSGSFVYTHTDTSSVGVRPALILSY